MVDYDRMKRLLLLREAEGYLDLVTSCTDELPLQPALRDRLAVATTLGFGPRFLHSTGQLHKGGPNSALVLQIVDEPADDLAVPETNFTFGALIQAQGLGDFTALKQRRRRALRVNLASDTEGGLKQLAEFLQS